MAKSAQRQFRIRTRDGFTREPLTEGQLVDLIHGGKLSPEDEAQRIGSERWRPLSELAAAVFAEGTPSLASPSPASPPREAATAEDDWLSEVATGFDAPAAPRPIASGPGASRVRAGTSVRPRSGGGSGSLQGVKVAGWVFVGLAGLETLNWLSFLMRTVGPSARGGFGSSAAPPVLFPIPRDLIRAFDPGQLLGLMMMMMQPLMVLGIVPGAILTGKLLAALPTEDRPASTGQNWFRWSLWLSAPAAALLLMKVVVLPSSMFLVPTVAAAAGSGLLILFALHIGSIARVVKERIDESGRTTLLPLGQIASRVLLVAAAVRAMVYLYIGYGLVMAERMRDPGKGLFGDLEWILSLANYGQVAGMGLLVAWAVDLAIKVQKVDDIAA